MTDREKVISDIEYYCKYPDTAPLHYYGGKIVQMPEQLMRDALALLKKSFIPEEVYDVVVEHAQHDTRFKLGDKIDYSFSDVVDILNIELMCKAGDM